MTTTPATIAWGSNLRARREALRLTQEQVAEITGLRQSTISKIEKGQITPRDTTKVLLASKLGCPVAALFPLEVPGR